MPSTTADYKMSLLSELQKKYPKAKYEPVADCPKCKGTGEWSMSEAKKANLKLLEVPDKMPCMCIFIEHKFLDMARETLKATIKKLKKEL